MWLKYQRRIKYILFTLAFHTSGILEGYNTRWGIGRQYVIMYCQYSPVHGDAMLYSKPNVIATEFFQSVAEYTYS